MSENASHEPETSAHLLFPFVGASPILYKYHPSQIRCSLAGQTRTTENNAPFQIPFPHHLVCITYNALPKSCNNMKCPLSGRLFFDIIISWRVKTYSFLCNVIFTTLTYQKKKIFNVNVNFYFSLPFLFVYYYNQPPPKIFCSENSCFNPSLPSKVL